MDKNLFEKAERGYQKLEIHFKSITGGRWDNISWQKNDVGIATKPFIDRHKFKSVYIRFKGEKTARVIPDVIFRRYFIPTTTSEIQPEKWTTSDKGGTKVKQGTRGKRNKLSKDEIKAKAGSSLHRHVSDKELKKGKTVKEETNLNEGSVRIQKQADGSILVYRQDEAGKRTVIGKTKDPSAAQRMKDNANKTQKEETGTKLTKFRDKIKEALEEIEQPKEEIQESADQPIEQPEDENAVVVLEGNTYFLRAKNSGGKVSYELHKTMAKLDDGGPDENTPSFVVMRSPDKQKVLDRKKELQNKAAGKKAEKPAESETKKESVEEKKN